MEKDDVRMYALNPNFVDKTLGFHINKNKTSMLKLDVILIITNWLIFTDSILVTSLRNFTNKKDEHANHFNNNDFLVVVVFAGAVSVIVIIIGLIECR